MSAGRIIGIVLGAFLLLGILAVGAGYYWWQTHGPALKAEVQALKAQAQAEIAKATEFGRSTDNQGCLEESLGRYARCEGGFTCNAMNNGFLSHCLKASSPAAGFCDGVPATGSVTRSVVWRLDQCEQRGRTETLCGNLFGQVQKYCDSLSPEPATDEKTSPT